MTRPAGAIPSRATDSGTGLVRRITSADGQAYAEALGAGFESPPADFAPIMAGPVLDTPGMSAYLTEVGGEALATGLGTLDGEQLGVFNIAVPPRHRRQGHGRVMTETILRDGFAAGATAAYLQSSSAGESLYRSLGFETVETWTYLSAP